MASLTEYFQSFFEARKRTPATSGPIDADGKPIKLPDPTGIADAGTPAASSQPGQTEKDTSRNGRYADFRAMDTGDIASLMDAVVESALSFEDQGVPGFRLDGSKSNAVRVIEETMTLTDFRQKVRTIARDLLKYGDAFVEMLEDKDGTVLRIQSYYPSQIYVISDEKGNVTGYQQNDQNGRAVATWKPEELFHFKWEPSDREPYSVSGLLDHMRDDWRDLRLLERGMVTGRTSRAYPRNIHYIDVTNKSTIDANKTVMGYIRAITRQIPIRGFNGFETITRVDSNQNEDIFLPTGYVQGQDGRMEKRLHDVKLLDPSMEGLANISDVEYVRRKLFATVPAEIVGIGQRDLDTAAQYRAYARTVRRLQGALERGLRQMFTQIMVMAGISPDNLIFLWPQIVSGENWKFQDAKYKQAMTEQLDIESKKHSRTWFMKQDGMTQEEIDLEFEAIKKEQEIFGNMLAPQSTAAQIARGGASGNSTDSPDISDGPDTQQNRDAQLNRGRNVPRN